VEDHELGFGHGAELSLRNVEVHFLFPFAFTPRGAGRLTFLAKRWEPDLPDIYRIETDV